MHGTPHDEQAATGVDRPCWELASRGVEETVTVGEVVGRHAGPGDLIALVGELGTGKTQFVRGIARGMGIAPDQVSSPTFVVVQEYAAPDGDRVLVHMDAYRLKRCEDVESIGWTGHRSELQQGAVVAVEWADHVGEDLGPDVLEIRLQHEALATRFMTLVPNGAWLQRMPTVWAEVQTCVASLAAH